MSSSSEEEFSDGDANNNTPLQMAQKENFQLRKELKRMNVQSNTETVQVTEDAKKRDEIAKSGRKYSLMSCPWIDTSMFENLKGRPNVDPNHESRYDSKTSMLAGATAELYDSVPQTLHEAMENQSGFISIFRNSVQGQRSNAILSVRQKAGTLFGFNQDYFETSFDRKTIPQMQALLKIPNKEGYALFAPVLFENNKYHPKHKKLFLNPLLPRIAKTMLCGRSSSASKPQTLADLWKVTSATPGLIAFSAILARFLISPDEELRKIGKNTGIKWSEEFMSYKQILAGDSKRVQEVMTFFNDNMFVNAANLVAAPSTLKDNADELKKAMQAFRDDYADSDSDGEGSGSEGPPPERDSESHGLSDIGDEDRAGDNPDPREKDSEQNHDTSHTNLDSQRAANSPDSGDRFGVENRSDSDTHVARGLDVANESEVLMQLNKKQRSQASRRGGPSSKKANINTRSRKGDNTDSVDEN